MSLFAAVLALPTLWIIGDSTVRNGSGAGTDGQWGWGDPLAASFDPAKIRVVNRAIGGRSSRTFQTDGRWDAILAEAKAGDFVLIQFGHNDPGAVNDDSRARGTLPGLGEEIQEIDNLLTKRPEVVHSFGWYLRKYVHDARAHGMTPIVCSYVPRCPRPGTTVDPHPVPGSYRLWSQQVAEAEKVPYIDLFQRIWSEYTKLTPDEIKSRYFTPADFTHTSRPGAELNATKVVEGIRAIETCPLRDFLLGPV